MAVSKYLMQRYQRSLGTPVKLLRDRINLEAGLADQELSARTNRLVGRMGLFESLGTGVMNFRDAKKAGYPGNALEYLTTRIQGSLNPESKEAETLEGYRQEGADARIGMSGFWEGRPGNPTQEAKDMINRGAVSNFFNNIKGLVPKGKPGETLGRFVPTFGDTNPKPNKFLASESMQRFQQGENVLSEDDKKQNELANKIEQIFFKPRLTTEQNNNAINTIERIFFQPNNRLKRN
tara:strand:- start:175 stop:882 length:708 start_codon:yes stop_codon:yes gene_type:complete